MASPLEFAFKLIDQASGPAKAAGTALEKVEAQLRAVDRAAKLEAMAKATDPLAKMRMGLELQRDALTHQADAADKSGAGLAGLAAKMGGVAGITQFAAEKFFELGTAAVGSVLSLAAAGAEYAAQMAMFKENTLFSLKYATGSAEAAGVSLDVAGKIARTLGMKTTDVATQMQQLMNKGYNAGQAETIVQGISDLKRLAPTADTGRVVDALDKIQMGGGIDPREIKELGKGGLNTSILYDKLADQLGIKGNDERAKQKAVDAALTAGRVPKEGQQAILDTIRQQGGGGPLGAVAKNFADTTITGGIDKIKSSFESLFLTMNTSGAGKTLGDAFRAISAALDPTTEKGKQLQAALESLVNGAAGKLGSLLSVDNIVAGFKLVVGAVEGINNAFTAVWPYVKAFGGGLWDGIKASVGPLVELFGKLFSSFSGGQGASTGVLNVIRMLGSAIGYCIGVIVDVVGVIVTLAGVFALPLAAMQLFIGGAIGMFTTILAKLFEFGSDWMAFWFGIAAKLWEIGGNIIDGLWNGIKAGWANFLAGFHVLIGMLPDAVKDVLGIHSPSIVFAELGGYTAAGFTQGVEGGMGEAHGALQTLVTPTLTLGGAGGAGGGGRGGNTISLSVVVQGARDAETTAHAVADVVVDKLLEMYEMTGIEVGAVGAPA